MKRVVFSDFDGTITAEETFVAFLKTFTPDLAAQLMPEIYAQRLTLREGVQQLIESIPTHLYAEVIEFSKSKNKLRPGFPEFLDFLDNQGVPCVVISGGVKVMVQTVLADLQTRVAGIHAIDLDLSGEFCQLISEAQSDTEMVAKVQIMAYYPCDQRIAIGDSVTDINMAMAADVVFARDRLAEYLTQQGKAYIPWHDFFEIRDILAAQWA